MDKVHLALAISIACLQLSSAVLSKEATPNKSSSDSRKSTTKSNRECKRNRMKKNDMPFSSLVSPSKYKADTKQDFDTAFRFQKDHKMNAAIDIYKRIVKDEPTCFESFYNLGLCYRYLGSDSDALAAFEQTAKLNPIFKPVFQDLADLYTQLGKELEAQSALSIYRQL